MVEPDARIHAMRAASVDARGDADPGRLDRSGRHPVEGWVKRDHDDGGGLQFAIVIPVHRQPGLVIEAIAAALREALESRGVVVLVNDGCPFAETHAVCLDFAEAHPDRVTYLRTANAGLPAARNRGIRHALTRFPGLGAIFLLDADNRLQPGSMRRALAALRDSGADWVYPDIDKFGEPFHADMSGPYSVLRHLLDNICDAGCLIHRRVFDAGLAFDESLRDGYEDWDFWLRCAAAGLRGAHCPDLGFQYRARRESMVAQADRQRAELLAGLQRRHPALRTAATVLRLEHQEAPRFCVVHDDHQQYHFTSTPGASQRRAPLIELERDFWQSVVHSGRHHFPPFILLLDRPTLLELQRLKLADWLFWQIETLLERHPTVSVQLVAGSRIACTLTPDAAPAHLLATCFTQLRDLATTPSVSAEGAAIRLEAPFRPLGGQPTGAPLLAMLRQAEWHATDGTPDWRARLMTPWPELYRSVRAVLGARGPLGRGGGDGGAEVGFLVPPGPIDARLLALAQDMRAAGWRTRLILEGALVEHPAPLIELFDVLCLFDPPGGGDRDGLLGLLAGCTTVIDGGSRTALAVMGELRRRGVVTVLTIGRDEAAIDAALAYEHALDVIAVASRAVCAARGLPVEKLVRWNDRKEVFFFIKKNV